MKALPAEPRMVTLPDGRSLLCTNCEETISVWREVVETAVYAPILDGLSSTATIVDVGANVGVASLFFADRLDHCRIFAFEPVPELHLCLRANLATHATSTTTVCAGIDSSAGVRDFTFYPRSPLQSGMYADAREDRRIVETYLHNVGVPRDDADRFLNGMFESVRLNVPVLRLADALNSLNIKQVELLKIDVERAELDVLHSIDREHWGIISRIVVEVHDIDNRLSKVLTLLKEKDYDTQITTEPFQEGNDLYLVFARRSQ